MCPYSAAACRAEPKNELISSNKVPRARRATNIASYPVAAAKTRAPNDGFSTGVSSCAETLDCWSHA